MTDLARLGLVIDSESAGKAKTDLDALVVAAGKAEKAVETLGSEAATTAVAIDKVGKEAAGAKSDIDGLAASAGNAERAVEGAGSAANAAAAGLGKAGVEAGKAGVGLGAAGAGANALIPPLTKIPALVPPLTKLPPLMRQNTGQLQQLSFQLNDVATMALSGASAFQILATQGGQLIQVMQMGEGGVKGTLSRITAGLLALPGPAKAAGVAVAALGAAWVVYESVGRTKVKSLDEVLADHAALVRDLKTAYGEAASGLDNYTSRGFGELQTRSRASMSELAIQARSQSNDLFGQLGSVVTPARSAQSFYSVSSRFAPFTDAIIKLRDEAKAGKPDVEAFIKTVSARAEAEPFNDSLLSTAGEVIKLADGLRSVVGQKEALQRFLDEIASSASAKLSVFTKSVSELSRLAMPEDTVGAQINRNYRNAIDTAPSASAAMAAQQVRDAALKRQEGELIKPFSERLRAQADENEMLGKATGVAEAYLAKKQLIYDAAKREIALSPAAVAAIDAQTKAYGELLMQKQRAQATSDLAFEAAQVGRNPVEQATATTMRGIYGDDYAQHMDDSIAATVRYNASLKAMDDATKSARDSTEKLNLQLALVGQPEGIKAVAMAALDAEQRIRALGLEGTAAADTIRDVATATALLNEQVRQRQAIYDAARTDRNDLEWLQAEVGLLGQSEAVRRRNLALLEAEQRIRDGGFMGSAADNMRQRAGAIADTTTVLERQTDAWQAIKDTGGGAIDSIVDKIGEGTLSLNDFLDVARDIGKEFLQLSVANPLKNSLFGENLPTISDVFDRLQGKTPTIPGLSDALASSVATMSVSAAVVNVNGGLGGLAGANDNVADLLKPSGIGSDSVASGNALNLARGSFAKVDDKLKDILQTAAAKFPLKVDAVSGFRAGDPRFHGQGLATDVQIFDKIGKAVPNYQNGAGFRTYEQFAQTAHQVQLDKYPELTDQFRWGGYFSGPKGKYGAADAMHFDLGGNKVGMGGGSWEGGLNSAQRNYFPEAESVGKSFRAVAAASDVAAKSASGLGGGLGDLTNSVSGAAAKIGQMAGGGSGISLGGINYASLGAPAAGGVYANGGVFEHSNIVPFARGGVVHGPTIFPFANGTGLMGEAGPEAIMPLRRLGNGRLGVESSGGKGGGGVNVFINNNHSGAKVTAEERVNEKTGQRELVATVDEMTATSLRRRGGATSRELAGMGVAPRTRKLG
ncbi:phage tail tape measure protein, lambda family [Kaistia soli DSM 19436]|uniref:Phage tail tape measure protein, lambda family n=1 Tax=Kaistia soli DSM 19436 TaxID=1122133 RepID=A0A1M5MT57_9HYPH|nr:phage tail length tape measure family protein [Kaistia soli]SHG79973.1 phage tail tape measure protein, lambda family [Kaistia soli DSM 19436]